MTSRASHLQPFSSQSCQSHFQVVIIIRASIWIIIPFKFLSDFGSTFNKEEKSSFSFTLIKHDLPRLVVGSVIISVSHILEISFDLLFPLIKCPAAPVVLTCLIQPPLHLILSLCLSTSSLFLRVLNQKYIHSCHIMHISNQNTCWS